MSNEDREAQELFMKIFCEATLNLAEIEDKGDVAGMRAALSALDSALFAVTNASHQIVDCEHMRDLVDRAHNPKYFAPSGEELAWILAGLNLLEDDLANFLIDELDMELVAILTDGGRFDGPSPDGIAGLRERLNTAQTTPRPKVVVTIDRAGGVECDTEGDVDVEVRDSCEGDICPGCKRFLEFADLHAATVSYRDVHGRSQVVDGNFCDKCVSGASEILWKNIEEKLERKND